MSPRRELDLLLQELKEHTDAIVSAARAARAAPEKWHRVVAQWTGSPPEHGIGEAGAANGADVYETLLVVERLWARRIDELEASLDEETRDAFEDTLDDVRHRTISGLSTKRAADYNSELRGPSNLGGVFARAAARQQKQAAPQEEVVRTMMYCRTCRAPREGSELYGNCTFCGEALFPGSGGG